MLSKARCSLPLRGQRGASLTAPLPLIALGMLALLMALWGGLVRLGWRWPLPWPTLSIVHGPLMVCGFLGTLIGIERAVALGAFWPYAAPLLTAVGTLALLRPAYSRRGHARPCSRVAGARLDDVGKSGTGGHFCGHHAPSMCSG